MIFKLITKYQGDPDENAWEEQYDYPHITNEEQAVTWGKQTIEMFNDTLRPGEKPRAFVGIRLVSNHTTKHEWRKQNLVTIIDRGMMYDTYKCEVCGITGKRHSIGGNVLRDRRYAAEKYAICDPSRKRKGK